MKKVIIAFIVLLVIILIIFIFATKKKVTIKEIKHLRLSYTEGYAMYAYTIYEIDYIDNEYILTTKPYGIPDEDAQKEVMDKNDIKKIESILNNYNVSSWDGFNKSDNNVLDGNSFSFSLRYDDDKTIEAHGYMRYPNNYSEVKKELINIFNNYYKD